MNRKEFDSLMKRRFFFMPSFGIYGGVSGLYDLGPPACAIKNNLIQLWRKHFIYSDSLYEIDTTSVTPYRVLDVSGHVEKFTDMLVSDLITGKEYRADHLVEDYMKEHSFYEEIDFSNPKCIHEAIKRFDIKSPETNNELSYPSPCNLMFETKIGPTGKSKAFLRPETAQGIFMNFDKLLELNGGKVPFAGACVGRAYRNEISQRSLIRVLEFTLCEIEHFVDPLDTSHRKIKSVENVKVLLYARDGKIYNITIREALDMKIIVNETLAYYLGRTHIFAEKIGLKTFRFRQHKNTEMAHYASDCWDMETLTSYGWLECVGIADRSCYDLQVHSDASSTPLKVFVPYDTPKRIQKLVVKLEKPLIGKIFKGNSKFIIDYFNSISEDEALRLQESLYTHKNIVIFNNGLEFVISSDMIQIERQDVIETGRYFIPNVIEPSFGIERLLYSLWEQSYYVRDSNTSDKIIRSVMRLPVSIAPVLCCVLPLMIKDEIIKFTSNVLEKLREAEISYNEDSSSASIGKRYARADEIGIPFAITVDYQSLEDYTVTLRERDSMSQQRIHINEICNVLEKLSKK